MNKVIIIFAIVIILFAGFIAYQLTKSMFTNGPALPTTEVTLKDQRFTVEIASTSAQKQQGLSGRRNLDKDRGMLFLFDTSEHHVFWMKDMRFPLDIVFIQDDKVVSLIENAQPPKEGQTDKDLPLLQPTAPANRVLEVQAGLVKEYGIKVGDTVDIAL